MVEVVVHQDAHHVDALPVTASSAGEAVERADGVVECSGGAASLVVTFRIGVVEADRDPPQAGGEQIAGEVRRGQEPVGRDERKVKLTDRADDLDDVLAEKRLAAGQLNQQRAEARESA